MTAQRILFELLVCFVLAIGGYFLGRADERQDQQAREKSALVASVDHHDQKATAGQAAQRKAVQRFSATDAVFNGITQGAILYAQTHPVANACRLDADGLRLWTDANAGAQAVAASDLPGILSAVAAAGKRRDDGSADQSPADGATVSPVPGPASGLDRLAGGH